MLIYFIKKRNHPNAQNSIIVFLRMIFKNFLRLIDVDHEGEKLSYGEYLARYYFVHHLANNHNNEKDMKSKKYRKKSDSRL